jgi:hypothetical protein
MMTCAVSKAELKFRVEVVCFRHRLTLMRHRIVGMTKLWSSTVPPLGQRWVTVLVRV